MNKEQIKHLVERFLRWKLPPDFSPDCGISFEKIGSKGFPSEFVREGALGPSGTNLFNFPQATEMVRYMVEGMPRSPDSGVTAAARRYQAAVKRLSQFKDGLTLFEGSPSKDADCYDAWLELSEAGRALDAAIESATA